MYTFTKRKNKPLYIPVTLQEILQALQEQDVRPVLVGGCVRDHFLNKSIKDYDIELFGCNDVEKIEQILQCFGDVKWVGKSFGVYKLRVQNDEFDFSLPRVEKKVALGYKGFDVQCDGMMDFKQACTRRDFTINALGYDTTTQTFLDPFNGLEDLDHHRLQHINDESFIQDPLRVYRAIGFCARFDLTCAPQTLKLCQAIVKSGEMQTLSLHRIFVEFKKLFLKSKRPSVGLKLLKTMGLFDIFIELNMMCCSSKLFFGRTFWAHTLDALDYMAQKEFDNDEEKLILMLAVLIHSFEQIPEFEYKNKAFEAMHDFLNRVCNDKKIIKHVLNMQHYPFEVIQPLVLTNKEAVIAQLAVKINLYHVALVLEAYGAVIQDKNIRLEYENVIEKFIQTASKLDVLHQPKKALIQGKDLIALGFNPSKQFSSVLQRAYILQLENPKLQKDALLKQIQKEFDTKFNEVDV
jgi:tRNA nucleotidyltransferase (CCA-adding enzyme)